MLYVKSVGGDGCYILHFRDTPYCYVCMYVRLHVCMYVDCDCGWVDLITELHHSKTRVSATLYDCQQLALAKLTRPAAIVLPAINVSNTDSYCVLISCIILREAPFNCISCYMT